MRFTKWLRLGSFALFMGAVSIGTDVQAGYFNCIGSNMQYMYYGQEVECGSQWQAMMCSAGCDYCFQTSCASTQTCTAGVTISGYCNNRED